MAVSKWTATHKADIAFVKKVVEAFGFQESDESDVMFVHKIEAGTHFREVKLKIRANEVVYYVHQEEDSVTEIYFEYLFEAGFIFGQIASSLIQLPVREGDVDDGDDDEDDDDDTELAGTDV